MNKGELIDRVSEVTSLTKKDVGTVLDATINAIMEAVATGDKVTLVGFGTIEPRDRAARSGRNPQTGAAIQIPATKVPAFSPGKDFKTLVATK